MFAQVLLPLPLQGEFTYHIPAALEGLVMPGHRVIVPFGRKKFYTGIVSSVVPTHPEGVSEFKDIDRILDDSPIVRHPQLKFWQWLSDYYLCTPGEVFRAALPAGLKIESESFVEVNEDYEESPEKPLTEREVMVLSHLSVAERKVSLDSLAEITGNAACAQIVASLLDKGAVRIAENLVERYRAKRETYVELTLPRGNNDELHRAFDAVQRSEQQQRALMALLDLSGFMKAGPLKEVTRQALQDKANVSRAVVDALVHKKLFSLNIKKINRFTPEVCALSPLPKLSDAQARALKEIHASMAEHEVTLLHGVTSSGKTEIYASLADHVMKQGRQVLYLVPEIALTTQLTTRLRKWFGDRVIIYHSRFSDNERVDLWRRLLTGSEPCLVLGARSSIFLPFASLGLVIVDEEHETSYKQQDPAPRYNARDAALMLSRMHGAKSLLGSATPAIDTYFKAKDGRYGLVTLTTRYSDAPLPEIQIVSMQDAMNRRKVNGAFSETLKDMVNKAVADNSQAILFLNRRGYSPIARCQTCGNVIKCPYCDVAMTWHKSINRLVCHYCGTATELPLTCPACKEPTLTLAGRGTERIHEEIEETFPGVEVMRMDLDTTRNKDAYQRIIDDFSKGRPGILVGTQMVTKGLDFGNVSLVGVINADAQIFMPDFHASERAYNMISQVAGRAGRRSDGPQGKVVVQTWTPDHPVIKYAAAKDYEGFFAYELAERRAFNYPPFSRIINIHLRGREEDVVISAAEVFAATLRQLFGNRVFGPDLPSVARVKMQFIRTIMLKIEVQASMVRVKAILREAVVNLLARSRFPGISVIFDVDPM
ncbi:MAG: primosomal protein N' [Muribaculaceae bacterium]|nr:primosomal protein N' [Muribaculaceae bacterium]